MENNNKPEKKFRCGGVTATVWKNSAIVDGENKDFHTVDITNNYKDKDGNWKTKSSYNATELSKVEIVAREAAKYLTLKTE